MPRTSAPDSSAPVTPAPVTPVSVTPAPVAPASDISASDTSASDLGLLIVDSPLGRIGLRSRGDALISVEIERGGTLHSDGESPRTTAVLAAAAQQLREYFAGQRTTFDLPVSVVGTPFQRSIWDQLATIPFGETRTYGELGLATGRASAGRAVGGAVGANPIPLIIPCHRVLGGERRITGYSAGEGVPTKTFLLDLEGIPHR